MATVGWIYFDWDDCVECVHETEDGCEYIDEIEDCLEIDLDLTTVVCTRFKNKEEAEAEKPVNTTFFEEDKP